MVHTVLQNKTDWIICNGYIKPKIECVWTKQQLLVVAIVSRITLLE